MLKSGLYIVSTPIGNLGDISERACQTLDMADIIACEDTRMAKKLFSLLGLKSNKKFICYEDHREENVACEIVELIKSGASIALISDAGAPLISDPGYKLVKLCRKQDIYVTAVPGASAVISALQLSGLPTNRFMFLGFIPNKQKARIEFLKEFQNINATLIFYETAPRLTSTLQAMRDIFQRREIAVAREITKIYEECLNGTADELLAHFALTPPKGEIVLMIAPPEKQKEDIDITAELKKYLEQMSLKDAVNAVSDLSGVKKNIIYQEALKLKK